MPITPTISGTEVREVYAKATDAQRSAFDAESTNVLIEELSTKYPAVAEELGKEVAYLILEFTTLTQFRSRLLQVEKNETVVADVVDKITKGVLMPMKNPGEVKKDALPAPIPAVPVRPTPKFKEPPPVVVIPPPSTKPLSAPSKPIVPTVQKPLTHSKMPVAAPTAKPVSSLGPKSPTPPANVPPPKTPAPPARPRVTIAPHPMRTMEQDAAKASPASPAAPKAPPPKPQRPQVWEAASAKPAPPKTENAAALADTLKKYGVDPYREPIE